MPYVEGKHQLIIEITGTASITLNEDDIVGDTLYRVQVKAINIIE